MTPHDHAVTRQLAALERRLRRTQAVALAAGAATTCLVLSGFVRRPPTADVLRARQLVIEDAAGRDRIILGAPMRDNFERNSPATGMAIRDTAGVERFGLSLNERGVIGMGFDAARCTSDPCNTERINITATADGRSQIRFLDSQTGVAARMELAGDDRVYLRFLKVTDDSITTRSLGLSGDTVTALPRRR